MGVVDITFQRLYSVEDFARAVPRLEEARARLVALINRRLAVPGLRMARDPANTPKDTGQLIRSIQAVPARVTSTGAEGALLVGVEYGRFQEFNHKTKGNYLRRAAEAVMAALADDLGKDRALEALGARVGGRRESV